VQFVDTHCHIQSAGENGGERGTRDLWSKAEGLTQDKILSNARDGSVNKLICVGCDLADSELAIKFVGSRDNCWASIGIHPHEAKDYVGQTDKLQAFRDLATKR